MISKFSQFIREGLRNKMVAKSREEVENVVSTSKSKPSELLKGAIEAGMLELVKKIIEENNLNINSEYRTSNGNPLEWAVYNDKTDIVEYLFELKCDPNFNSGRAMEYSGRLFGNGTKNFLFIFLHLSQVCLNNGDKKTRLRYHRINVSENI